MADVDSRSVGTPSSGNEVLHFHVFDIVDAPDQAGVVRQYMRFTAKLQSGRTAAKTILRALQM